MKQLLKNIRAQVLKPKSDLSVVEWADTYRVLSPEASSTQGKWNTSIVEAARGPMLAVTESGVKKITVMGPTQLLKTELINNVIGYFTHQAPSPVIVMQPTDKLCETFAVDRLEPMFRDSKVLQGLINHSNSSRLHKVFTGGQLTIVSAGSASDLASRPVRIVLMDECDKYKSVTNEGDPIKLIEQRQDTFWNALSIAVCSPTTEGQSRIAERFEDSDQRLFHGECVHCGHIEHLVWEQVKWSDGDSSTAAYECSNCKVLWTETDRLKAISQGRYIASKPFNGHAGFHVNAIASPWQSLQKLVQKFLDAKNDNEKLRVFINTSLAETWKQKLDTPDYMRLYERRENYSIGRIPSSRGILFLTMGVDVQQDRLEYQVLGWTKDKQSYSIDYGAIHGYTHLDESWNELKKQIDKKYYYEESDSHFLLISFTAIDSGFNTQKVYEFVAKQNQNRVRAIKGSDGLPNIYKSGNEIGIGATRVWMAGSSFCKEILYSNLKLQSGGDTGIYPSGFCHYPQYDEDFFKSLTSEALIQKKVKGRMISLWQKIRARNEALDTWVYSRVAASMYGLDRFNAEEFSRLESRTIEIKEDSPKNEAALIKQQSPQPSNGLWKNKNLKRSF